MNASSRDSHDVVVIGAGPAGLAVARELEHQHGIHAVVVDRAAAPAMSWRRRYDNFRLNTTGFLSHLPGQRIPLTAGRWPTKEDMVRYFDRYVQRQDTALMLGCEVHRIDRSGGQWHLDTSSGEIRSTAIILATGNSSALSIPAWPGLNRFGGAFVHSGDFVNAWPYRGRDVLLVGAGNSAADIAVQLADGGARRIWLSVRTPPHLVRRAMGPFPSDIFLELFAGVPARVVDPLIAWMNRLLWGDLSELGFPRPPLGLKATVEQRGRIPTLARRAHRGCTCRARQGRWGRPRRPIRRRDPRRRHVRDATGDRRRHRLSHRSRRSGRPPRRARQARQPTRWLCLPRRRRNVRDWIRHSAQWPAAGYPSPCDTAGPRRCGVSAQDRTARQPCARRSDRIEKAKGRHDFSLH
ncbi:flavin-containing monooxygenase [Mycobacterium sp. ML4]